MNVVFTGYAHSGKTTCSNYLVEEFGFNKVSFADPVKEYLAKALAYIEEGGDELYLKYLLEMNTPGLKELFRPGMQWLGTDYYRCKDPRFWIEKIDDKLGDRPSLKTIDDARFQNECEYLIDKGFIIVRIVRGEAGLKGFSSQHSSESEIDKLPYHYMMLNNGPLMDLYDDLNSFVKSISCNEGGSPPLVLATD